MAYTVFEPFNSWLCEPITCFCIKTNNEITANGLTVIVICYDGTSNANFTQPISGLFVNRN